MKFYLMRHAEAEHGEPMDVSRSLTSTGKKQIPIIIDFLKTQTKDIGLVMVSDMHRGIDTGEPIAEAFDVECVRDPEIGPNGDPETAWKHILKQAKALPKGDEILVVSHGKLVNRLAAWLLESGEGDKFHFSHGSVAHFDTEHPDDYGPYHGGDAGQPAMLHWMVTAKLCNRIEEDDPKAVIEAALKLADVTLDALGIRFDEAGGAYYYDTTLVKRVIEGDSASGPCDSCDDNINEGWIDADDVYPSGDDGPPFHPGCVCVEEYKEKRVRVYEAARGSEGDVKIPKEAVLYIFRPETQYTCDKCVFFKEENKCAQFGPAADIKGYGSCGFWVHKDPAEMKEEMPWIGLVTPAQAGYAENKTGFSCKRCEYYDELDCEKVDKDSDGDTPGIIHPNACCNRWEPDKVRAKLPDTKLLAALEAAHI